MKKQQIPSFASFRDIPVWENFIIEKLRPYEQDVASYLRYWYQESHEKESAYPSQGMLLTPFDFLPVSKTGMLPPEKMVKILRVRQYFLELFNHPERIQYLQQIQRSSFQAPPKVKSVVMERIMKEGVGASISDLGIAVVGSQNQRVSRTERLAQGPFIKLGKYARSLLVGSAMPDIYGSVSALSTMAQCHCLVGVPRNGVFNNIQRQVDLVHEVWNALEESEVLIGRTPKEKKMLLEIWKRNIMGVLEVEPHSALLRARRLYEAGVRVFRVYSPEPGLGALQTVQKMREEFGKEVEIFAGQVVDVQQAKQLEEAGSDGLYIGIGGGGRCITGVRSGSVVDWPVLLWKLRGEINIPVVVEGGASDHIAVTLALGATGIGVSRIVGGGTIESPGGMMYCLDQHGLYFKPYGGEASARTKYLDNKMLPFEIPSFVEGETRPAYMEHLAYGQPTIAFRIFSLIEDSVLSFVFRGVSNLSDLQSLDPSPLLQSTSQGVMQQQTH